MDMRTLLRREPSEGSHDLVVAPAAGQLGTPGIDRDHDSLAIGSGQRGLTPEDRNRPLDAGEHLMASNQMQVGERVAGSTVRRDASICADLVMRLIDLRSGPRRLIRDGERADRDRGREHQTGAAVPDGAPSELPSGQGRHDRTRADDRPLRHPCERWDRTQHDECARQ